MQASPGRRSHAWTIHVAAPTRAPRVRRPSPEACFPDESMRESDRCPACGGILDDSGTRCLSCGLAAPAFAHLESRLDEFEQRLAALELAVGVGERQAALARHVARAGAGRRRRLEVASLVGAPLALLFVAHYVLMLASGDLDPRQMLAASVAIPLPFGFLVAAGGLRRSKSWLLGSVAVGLLATLGMNLVSTLMHGSDVLPATAQDAWEFVTYAISIALSFAAGLILGLIFWQYVTRGEGPRSRTRWQYRLARFLVGRHFDAEHAHRATVELLRIVRVLAALAAIAGSVYSGWLRFRG